MVTATKDNLRDMIGHRVTAVLNAANPLVTVTGMLRGVPTEGTIIIQDVNFTEHRFAAEDVTLDPYVCTRCHSSSDTEFDGLCAKCVRVDAEAKRKQGKQSEPCWDCGGPGAFRNPGMRSEHAYRCARCHAKAGTLTEDFSVIQAAAGTREYARCVNDNIDSPRHDWRQIATMRWRCAGFGCNADRFTNPAKR